MPARRTWRRRRSASAGESATARTTEAIKRLFTPEFRNRLDAIITFAGLTQEIVGRVVEKFVMQLEAQLADRNVTIELSSAAKEWLAERGYDRLYGARPLGRVIQEHIKKPLAEELLFGKLVQGGSVKVALKDGQLEFEYIRGPAQRVQPGDGTRAAPSASRRRPSEGGLERACRRGKRRHRHGGGERLLPRLRARPGPVEDSDHTSVCSWKGTARYYTLNVGGEKNRDAVWFYPDPKPGATQVRDRVAFWKGVEVG